MIALKRFTRSSVAGNVLLALLDWETIAVRVFAPCRAVRREPIEIEAFLACTLLADSIRELTEIMKAARVPV